GHGSKRQRTFLDLTGPHVRGEDVAISGGNRGERAPVVDGGAQPRERLEMLGDTVAFVVLEAVARIEQAQPRHEPVARDLGDDGSSSDRGENGIAADHSFAVAAGIDAIASVDEHELRPNRQACDGASERPQRRPQDIVAVDAPWRRNGNGDLRRCANFCVQLFARLRIELFGIIKSARHALRIEHDSSRNDRTGKGPPARFVAAGNRPHTAFDRCALAAEGRAEVVISQRQPYHANGTISSCAGGGGTSHGGMVRAAACKSTVPRSSLWRTLDVVFPASGRRRRKSQNKVSCSAACRGGQKWSVVSRVRVLLKPSFSQANSKRRPIIQATGPVPVMRVFQ